MRIVLLYKGGELPSYRPPNLYSAATPKVCTLNFFFHVILPRLLHDTLNIYIHLPVLRGDFNYCAHVSGCEIYRMVSKTHIN